jgi:Ca2+-binding RTX toxin-like protein
MAAALAPDHVKAPTAVPEDPVATRLPRRAPGLGTAPYGRRPRAANLDSLAIGAPLTAAFVGVLLAEAGVAGSGAQAPGAQSGATAAGGLAQGEAGPSATVHGKLPAMAAGSDGAVLGAAGSHQAALDPVSASAASAEAALPQVGTASGRADGAASEVSAALGGQAGSAGGASFSMTMLNLDDGATDGGATDGDSDGDGATGTIGDHVTGGDGDDVIHGTPGDDHIAGGAGDDVIFGHAGDDTLLGETGNDQLFGGAGDDLLDGGPGRDQLFGGDGNDDLFGGTGADQLFGEAGDDQLDGGPGNDLLDGGPGVDQLQGGTGNDVLAVDNLHDVALDNVPGPNGGGSDTLQVDDGLSDSLAAAGRPENVTFVFSANLGIDLPAGSEPYTQQVAPGIEHLVLEGSADHDALGDATANRITGNDGDNALYGRGGDDILSGAGGDDWLDGGGGRDRLEGDAGNDILNGGDAADLLYGGAGDDVLNGGRGSDQLYGGAGNDTFVIGLNDSAVDTVFDHEGSNRLALEGYTGGDVQAALLGDDLHLVVDHSAVAVISGYRGHEDAFAGIDFGQGLVPFADLLAPNADTGPAAGAESIAPATAGADDLLSGYLAAPSLSGGAGADALSGTSGADWLSGLGGNDHLQGGAGDDVLEGGPGSDLLEGGAGDDRYLFKLGDAGLDTIRDAAGSNFAELKGVAGARLEGAVVGNDLYVVADHAPVFKVEGFVGHEDSFAGVQTDDGFVPTEDLFG